MYHDESGPTETKEVNAINQTVDEAELTGRPTGLGCFKCQGELEIANVAGFKIAACGTCHGLLIQNSHLSGLVNVLRAAFDKLDAAVRPLPQDHLHEKTQCQACGIMMETHAYMGPGNIAIDSCRECKMVWLDANELTRVIQAPGRREFRSDELIDFEPGLMAAQAPLRNMHEDAVSPLVAMAWLMN